jgi:hypothetical protein
MARAPEQALRRLGILDRHNAVGDLDQGARKVLGLDARSREGVGEIFAGAAEIEQEIDADIVADECGEPDDRALALLVATAVA